MLAIGLPFQLTHFTGAFAAGLFALLAVPIIALGYKSMAGMGPTRQWTSIVIRLLLILLIVLTLGGITWTRRAEDVHVMVLRDTSESTNQVRSYPGKTLDDSINDYLRETVKAENGKLKSDRIGLISFNNRAYVDMVADTTLSFDARAIRERGSGTDIASAVQLALATLQKDAMHRLVLVSDGNQTTGDIEAAISAANAAQVPIDVLPLSYNIKNEVLVERFIAPTRKRENEPFTLEVLLYNTNKTPTPGKMTVLHQGLPMDLDPTTPGVQQTRAVSIQSGRHIERVQVPPLADSGVHQFRAVFESDDAAQQAGVSTPGQPAAPAKTDTLSQNNAASTFTFVSGKGQVLYIDNVNNAAKGGDYLRQALVRQGINLDEKRKLVSDFPNTTVELQNYDAIILNNVPRGPGGLTDSQGDALASYVHDMGGGLLVIGGPDALGAGGWQGTRLEKVLPLDMEVPAKRTIPKGALCMVMHACEFPDGNYWGAQCALKAVEVLNARDDIGVITFGWAGGGSGWDYPLSPKEDGSRVNQAIKNMSMGDMPSFDESLNLALNGDAKGAGIIANNAKNRHIIIISDGDPQAPNDNLIKQCLDNKITISTVSVYPHDLTANGLPPTMRMIAERTGGKAYGPINGNFSQLPQIFIKEASIIRRSLIQEDKDKGLAVSIKSPSSEAIKGLGDQLPGLVYGMVLSSKKPSPQVEMPLVAGPESDPLLANWQSGLGRAAVYTSDSHNVWGSPWVTSNIYDRFWSQIIRTVARPAESADFDVQISNSGGKGKIIVEAVNKNNQFRNGLAIRGTVVGPDMQPREVRLAQTAPGTYEASFDAMDAGNYVVGMSYNGSDGQSGVLRSGTVVNSSPELRDLRSNETVLQQIAQRTGGRVLKAWDPKSANLFDRTALIERASPMQVWDYLLPFIIALLILDVAVRRIAWDWASIKRAYQTATGAVKSMTTTRKVDTTQSLDALRKIRNEGTGNATDDKNMPAITRPDPSMKFEAKGDIKGDITQVVGGATDKPIPKHNPKTESKPTSQTGSGDHTNSLLEAKRRAQQKIKEREDGNN